MKVLKAKSVWKFHRGEGDSISWFTESTGSVDDTIWV